MQTMVKRGESFVSLERNETYSIRPGEMVSFYAICIEQFDDHAVQVLAIKFSSCIQSSCPNKLAGTILCGSK